MDLGKLNRNAEDRSVVWAAVVTAFLGLAALLQAGAAGLNGRTLDSRVALVMGLVFLGLAYGVYRGSRVAAVGVVSIFLLNASVTLLLAGVSIGALVWLGILGTMLWAGMRGVFAQAVRPALPRVRQ